MKHQKIEMAHLHMHSTYSELDAISKIPDIVSRLKEYGHTSAALTDHGTIAGVPEFYTECNKQGVKPILASEFYMMADANKAKEDKDRKNHHLILLAMDDEGWTNIKKLTTKANEKFYYAPRIDYNDLKDHSNGIICLTACLKGIVPYNIMEEKFDLAYEHAQTLKGLFGDRFYMELEKNPTTPKEYWEQLLGSSDHGARLTAQDMLGECFSYARFQKLAGLLD